MKSKSIKIMTKEQAIQHNREVISNVIQALIEERLVDPVRMLTDHSYMVDNISTYIKAANIAREMMHMPKLFLYEIPEE